MAIDVREAGEQPVVYQTATTTRAEFAATLGKILPYVWGRTEEHGGHPVGPPFVRFRTSEEPFEIEAGLPVGSPLDAGPDIDSGSLPGGRHAVYTHVGAYEGLPDAWAQLKAWLVEREETAAGPGWEVYISDPGAEPDPGKWVTEVIIPLA
jgi:effector-binding domain-containing protein